MSIEIILTNTSLNVFKNTEDDIWHGIITSVSDEILKYAVRKFYFTITGAEDSTTDIEIPISSFQGRKRNGESTYLAVVVKDLTYIDEIVARPNGEIYVELAYELSGVEVSRYEIIRGSLETITYDEGSKSKSITISGTKTETWEPKAITLTGNNYKRDTNDSFIFRFSDIDVNVKPGDTVTVGDDTFVPERVSFTVSARINGITITMELGQ